MHLGQCDLGVIIDRFFGVLMIITLRKLPMIAPNKNASIYTLESAVPKWKIGRYVAIIIIPITPPTKIISAGSIIDVSLSTLALTCFV